MIDPENDMLMVYALIFGVVAIGLAVAIYKNNRKRKEAERVAMQRFAIADPDSVKASRWT